MVNILNADAMEVQLLLFDKISENYINKNYSTGYSISYNERMKISDNIMTKNTLSRIKQYLRVSQ